MTDTPSIVAFVAARLDETERIASAATPGPWRPVVEQYGAYVEAGSDPERYQVIPPDVDYGAVVSSDDVEHIVHHDPARMLAEVKARRQRLQLIAAMLDGPPIAEDGPEAAMGYLIESTKAKALLRLEIQPYADEPGFREEWRL